jgi:hypothetical protein
MLPWSKKLNPAGLSFYERAWPMTRSVGKRVFRNGSIALGQIFTGVSRSKRTKVGNWVGLVRMLDPVLKYPINLTESIGLALAQALEANPSLRKRLQIVLQCRAGSDSTPRSADHQSGHATIRRAAG